MRFPTRPSRFLPIAVFACATASHAFAEGEIVTVTTLNDVVDVAGSSLADLPGPDGLVSFREALAVVNQEPGAQTVGFAIPPEEWWLFDGEAVLRLEDGAFVVSGDHTTLDFTTQTAAYGDTNPNGGEVGIYGLQPNGWGIAAIFVSGNDCVIKGLGRVMQRGYGVEISGDRNRVIGCTITGSLYAGVIVEGFQNAPATDNVIGGTEPGEGNVLSGGNCGVRVDGPCDGTVVVGNTIVGSPYAGVQVRGAYCCEWFTPVNTRIGGPTPEEGNWIADNGKFGEEGFPLGTQVEVEWAIGTLVEGNTIGTTEAGDAAYPGGSGTAGVSIRESETTVVRGNLISGMRKEGVNHYDGDVFGVGISVFGPNTGVEILGNLVGTDASGTVAVPNLSGISLGWFQGDPSGAVIGGASPGEGNTIAFNETRGVVVSSGTEGVAIRGNSIHSNGDVGIDLLTSTGAGGVTANDLGDVDAGANGLQNFPVLTSAESDGSSVEVTGSLNSGASGDYVVDLYAGVACDPSGHGEGRSYLGSVAVTTDAAGNASVAASLPASVAEGDVVTATATEVATGNTSEFSACVSVEAAAPLFLNMGGGLAGMAGIPDLRGAGSLIGGEPTTLEVTDAHPDAAALLIVGLEAVHAPLAGGTLVPAPQILIPLATDQLGTSAFTAPWPMSLPSGARVYVQEWVVDAMGPAGLSASNALQLTTP